ncbi:FERM domain-containing protein 5 [Bienertia sinuspersici]
MDGYFRRIWKEHGVDKIITIDRGTFLIRFNTMEQRDKILTMGRVFFDYKPVVLKPWHVDMELNKEDIQRIPIWVKLNLHFKYWGQTCMERIINSVGTLIKVDSMTANREKLQYARCMIEVKIDQAFPEAVRFKNEKNEIVIVDIAYEWKPESCKKCKKLGHDETQCYMKEKTSKVKQVWQQKGLVLQGTGANGKKPNTGGAIEVHYQTQQGDYPTRGSQSGPSNSKKHGGNRTEETDQTMEIQEGQEENRVISYSREKVQSTNMGEGGNSLNFHG